EADFAALGGDYAVASTKSTSGASGILPGGAGHMTYMVNYTPTDLAGLKKALRDGDKLCLISYDGDDIFDIALGFRYNISEITNRTGDAGFRMNGKTYDQSNSDQNVPLENTRALYFDFGGYMFFDGPQKVEGVLTDYDAENKSVTIEGETYYAGALLSKSLATLGKEGGGYRGVSLTYYANDRFLVYAPPARGGNSSGGGSGSGSGSGSTGGTVTVSDYTQIGGSFQASLPSALWRIDTTGVQYINTLFQTYDTVTLAFPAGGYSDFTVTLDDSLVIPAGKALQSAPGVNWELTSVSALTVDGKFGVSAFLDISAGSTAAVSASGEMTLGGGMAEAWFSTPIQNSGAVVLKDGASIVGPSGISPVVNTGSGAVVSASGGPVVSFIQYGGSDNYFLMDTTYSGFFNSYLPPLGVGAGAVTLIIPDGTVITDETLCVDNTHADLTLKLEGSLTLDGATALSVTEGKITLDVSAMEAGDENISVFLTGPGALKVIGAPGRFPNMNASENATKNLVSPGTGTGAVGVACVANDSSAMYTCVGDGVSGDLEITCDTIGGTVTIEVAAPIA
ncbi:hypothetical protein LJC32_07125, partial [Oscillospiraceae bacterium OttesenSCG-928-F05]|nr:hypothetical protein [Oscillospiraceae bacterium OttesenSCG-928-F05]